MVGYLGDGINDAPSLRTADVGISVDSAVDVAKDAADIILLQQDLAFWTRRYRRAAGLRQHHEIHHDGHEFEFREHVLDGGGDAVPAVPADASGADLLNNLLYAVWNCRSRWMRSIGRSPRSPSIGTWVHPQLHAGVGPVSSVFDFLTFGLLLLVFHADEALFQTGWFIESLATQTLVIFASHAGNPLKTRRILLPSPPWRWSCWR